MAVFLSDRLSMPDPVIARDPFMERIDGNEEILSKIIYSILTIIIDNN